MKHLFFDIDRTLWDFETNSKNALQKLYDSFQLENHFDHFIQFQKIYSSINKELWKKYGKGKVSKEELRNLRFIKTLEKVNVYEPVLANELNEKYLQIAPYEKVLFPNVKETLDQLSKKYKLHIITNGFQDAQLIKLEQSEIRHYFDVIVCSETVGKTKPHREIFEHALKVSGASIAESIMIGDDPSTDILGANQMGMNALLFDHQNQRKKSFGVKTFHDFQELPLKLVMYHVD